eukprot:UN04195
MVVHLDSIRYFHVSEPTQEHSTDANIFQIRGYHPLWRFFPKTFFYI